MGSIAIENTPAARHFPSGIHVPSLTWFKDDEVQSLDWDVQEQHLKFLVDSGLHGSKLLRDEKLELVRRTRSIAQSRGKPQLPITMGCGGGCTRLVIEETKDSAAAGADFALVLVPSYFHFAMDSDAIIEFFLEVADKSPIPVVIYNYPAVVAGLDVNSSMLDRLGDHPNIVGVKLTCGGIAKVARVAAKFGAALGTETEPSFKALAGQSDWLVPALAVGGAGCITGLANLYPKTCIEMYNLWKSGQTKESNQLQVDMSVCEIGFGQGGINGTKWVVAHLRGYPETSAHCRRPYPVFADEKKKAWVLSTVKLCSHIERAFS